MPKNWSKYPIIGAIVTAISSILAAMVEGIIGNRADLGFSWLVDQVGHLTVITWLLVLLICSLILLSFCTVSWLRTRHELAELNRRSERLLVMDHTLLRHLSILVSVDDMDTVLHELVDKLLYDAVQEFPEVRKASLLLPDIEREYLLIRQSSGWVGEHRDPHIRFYIGSHIHDRKGGAAGEAFLKKELIVTKFTNIDGAIMPNRGSYVFFGDDREDLPYRSLVCVPIIAGKNVRDSECMGVICLDSKHADAFDAPSVHTILHVLSKRMAAALEIYYRLQNVCHIPQHKL